MRSHWHARRGYDAADPLRTHVFPDRIDLDDIFHLGDGQRVQLPFAECALCAAGICVQRIGSVPNLIVHARDQLS